MIFIIWNRHLFQMIFEIEAHLMIKLSIHFLTNHTYERRTLYLIDACILIKCNVYHLWCFIIYMYLMRKARLSKLSSYRLFCMSFFILLHIENDAKLVGYLKHFQSFDFHQNYFSANAHHLFCTCFAPVLYCKTLTVADTQ